MNKDAASSFDTRRVTETVTCTVLAGLAGSHAVTVATAILSAIAPDWLDDESRVIEASLLVILVVTALSVVVAAHAIRRRWVHVDTFVAASCLGVVAAFFDVIRHSVLNGPGQPLYFFGWTLGLWFLPALFLPNPNGTLEERIERAFGLLAVAAPMTVIGLVTGLIVQEGAFALVNWMLPSHELYRGGVEKFWIAKPVGVNAVGCALAVVACANLWWPGLRWSAARARVWTLVVTGTAAAYAGLWGPCIYRPDGSRWVEFVGFGLLPIVVVVALCGAYAATRRGMEEVAVGWAVSRHFWWMLPTVFLFAFGVNAALGLAPIEEYVGIRRAVLMLVHGLNGAVMGANLWATASVFRLVPESVRRAPPLVGIGRGAGADQPDSR